MESLSPELCRTFFTGISDAVTVIDRDYRIVWANDRRAEVDHQLRVLSGRKERAMAPRYTLADMVGRRCYERFRRRSAPCPGCPSVTVFRTGKPCTVERRIDLPTGSKRWGETRAYPVLDRTGNVEYVVKLSVDITERKQREEKEERRARAMAALVRELAGHGGSPSGGEGVLTGREKEVIRLVAHGLSNIEIAGVLSISPHTVKRHVVHIFTKLGVKDRAQAALWASRHNLA